MDRFLIAPSEGLRTDLKAWQIPDEAYARLTNAYIFRGMLKKRIGSLYTGSSSLNSRLRVLLGTTDGTGVFPAAPAKVSGALFKVGQQFSIGTQIFTVHTTGTPVTMRTTGAGVGTFNTTTGYYTFTGCALATAVYWYPSEPVLGLTQYEAGTVHNQVAFAFDTQFAYKFSGADWVRDGSFALTGNDYNFVWAYNWDGNVPYETYMFITNFNVATGAGSPKGDSMYYYNGATWTAWRPQFIAGGAANTWTIQTAKIIIPFKGRLLLMNTIESDNTTTPTPAAMTNYAYTNRVRYSQNGSPINVNAFMEPDQSVWKGGGYIDGPTEEDIIGAELIRDRCIVYFERSTWELAYTGNEAIPFVWQQINTELGSEAQFSNVPFDKFILNIGPNGIQQCNGVNVDRIDDKIPDEVFNIRIKNQGMQRVAGVRDYYTEMVYWTYPTDDNAYAVKYPNKMFVFNYKNGTWAINDDCITAFGYFEQETDLTWATIQGTWEQNNQSWTSNVNAAQFRNVIAGNQHGYVTKLVRDSSSQVANLNITNITYSALTKMVTMDVLDHSFAVGDYIKLSDVAGTTLSGIYKIYDATKDTIILNDILSDPGTYLGGGLIARIPRIDILSKEWNPYKKDNRGVQLLKVDFGVQRTDGGEVTINYYPSHTELNLAEEANNTGSSLGACTLETSPYDLIPLESRQRLLWHTVYLQGEGDSVQIGITLNEDQMADAGIVESDFILEGLILYTQPTIVR